MRPERGLPTISFFGGCAPSSPTADLSKRAMLSQSRIKQLEEGEIGGQLDTYVRLAGALGITVADLLAGVAWTPAAIEREVQAGYEVVFEVASGDDKPATNSR